MKMIIGLGNPGKQYEKTRHNVGFKVIDELCNRLGASTMQSKFNGMYTILHRAEGKIMLVKPLTYMNLSGECIGPLMDYYEVNPDQIVVIYDDLDLPPGTIRLRQKGSAGGHNGMKSLIAHLDTDKFNRIRIGVGRPISGMKVSDYVLSTFIKEEVPLIEDVVKKSASACETWLEKPFLDVMNDYNGI